MPTLLDYTIRSLLPEDQHFLREMGYQAIYVLPGEDAPSPDIVNHPDIAKYVKDWGRSDDLGFLAEASEGSRPLGAAWMRLFKSDNKGYGYVDDLTPELSIAVLPDYRGKGVGTRLLTHLLEAAKDSYSSVSLSVSPDNPAQRLYKRMGFEVVGEYDTSLTMKVNLKP